MPPAGRGNGPGSGDDVLSARPRSCRPSGLFAAISFEVVGQPHRCPNQGLSSLLQFVAQRSRALCPCVTQHPPVIHPWLTQTICATSSGRRGMVSPAVIRMGSGPPARGTGTPRSTTGAHDQCRDMNSTPGGGSYCRPGIHSSVRRKGRISRFEDADIRLYGLLWRFLPGQRPRSSSIRISVNADIRNLRPCLARVGPPPVHPYIRTSVVAELRGPLGLRPCPGVREPAFPYISVVVGPRQRIS